MNRDGLGTTIEIVGREEIKGIIGRKKNQPP
jgi:hypothetical protein